MKKFLALATLIGVLAAMFAVSAPVFAQEEDHFHVLIDAQHDKINLKSNGVTQVALYGAAGFDVLTVDLGTVGLHPHERMEGAIPPVKAIYKDANKDGYLDIVFHFSVRALAPLILPGDTVLCLHGDSSAVGHFCGEDTVVFKFA